MATGRARGPGAAVLGVASVALLAAALRWAHHWSAVADTLVAAWAVSTVLALVASIRAFRVPWHARRFAKLGLALAGVSVLALVLAGLLWAAGINAAGACGGG